MICTKCGSEYKDSYRACIKCGALNEEHPLNKDLINFTNKSKKKKIRESKDDFNSIFKEERVETKRINITLFAIVNLLLYGLLIYIGKGLEEDFIGYILAISIFYFYFLCNQLLLKKASLPWWGVFIPIYDIYLSFKLAFNHPIRIIVLLVLYSVFNYLLYLFAISNYLLNLYSILVKIDALIGIAFSIIYTFCLGRKFGRSGILTVLFGFVIIPSTALDSRFQYIG